MGELIWASDWSTRFRGGRRLVVFHVGTRAWSHRYTLLALALLATVLTPTVRATAQDNAALPVRINEFLASNEAGLTDRTGEHEDWIELHNSSASDVDLAGWELQANDDTHTFESVTIEAGDYLVLFASGDPDRSTPGELHVDFKLSAAGESLVLTDPDGSASSPSWPAPGYPAQVVDDSYGVASGGNTRYFLNPTPNAANRSGVAGRVEPVTFSVPHGYYDATQQVVLDTATVGASIRYTLDGSAPTSASGIEMSPGSSIAVAETSVVRAAAFRPGWATSSVETQSYLFADDIVDQPETPPPGWPADSAVNEMRAWYGFEAGLNAGALARVEEALVAIPTMSITTDVANLFDPDSGIWSNPTQRGPDWEIPISVELIDPTEAQPGFQINAGLRIRGNSSRSPKNFKHSMRLVFNDAYGDGNLEYPLFGDEGTDQFESVDLKTSQSWSWNSPNSAGDGRGTEATWLRDVWNRDSQLAMGGPAARGRYAHTFINGQYWGLYMTEERVSNQYGADYYGGDESDFDVIKRAAGELGGNRHSEARDGELDDWLSLWPLVEDRRLTNAEWAIFREQVDLVSLADFYVLMFFGGDSDSTPRYTKNISNNWLALRNRSGAGGASKWLFNDRDSESALCTNVGSGRPPNWDPTPPWNLDDGVPDYLPAANFLAPAWLFEAGLTQPEFVQIFQDRVHRHLIAPGGALTTPVSIARLDARASVVDLVIDAEAARWGDTWVADGFDRSDWEQATQTVRDCFALRRSVIEQYLRADGLWPETDAPQVNPPGASVAASTQVSIAGNGGTLWVTTDGTDPRAPDGAVSAEAFVYGGPIPVTDAMTIKARVAFGGGEWSPLARHDYSLSSLGDGRRLLLNEFNAVGASNYLGGGLADDIDNGSDSTFGRIPGNGGDWFELVVVDDGLDIRGWSVEIWHEIDGIDELSARLTFAEDPTLMHLRSGTLITISESIADDASYSPITGDWHINLQSNSDDDGAYITAESQKNFAIDNDNTRIAIFDKAGQPEALPTGEGVLSTVTVSSTEVFKLEAPPTSTIQPTDAAYNDGTSSTWGLPNRFGDGIEQQDFAALRRNSEDPSCDGSLTLLDALLIAQFAEGQHVDAPCPLSDPATQINALGGDLNDDGTLDRTDVMLILECSSGAAVCSRPQN